MRRYNMTRPMGFCVSVLGGFILFWYAAYLKNFPTDHDKYLFWQSSDLFNAFVRSMLGFPQTYILLGLSILSCYALFEVVWWAEDFFVNRTPTKIRVRLSNGQTGKIDPKEFDPQTMEKL